MQNQTKSICSNLQSSFEDAQADQGLGSLGEWPPRGSHNCYVLNMTIQENGTFKEAQASGGQEHDAIVVQFGYQLVEDPDRAEPLEWRGAPITLPHNPSAIGHEGSQTRARIEMQRLKDTSKHCWPVNPVICQLTWMRFPRCFLEISLLWPLLTVATMSEVARLTSLSTSSPSSEVDSIPR